MMDRYAWPQTDITIIFQGGLYLGIIMECYVVTQTAIIMALHWGH
jgi:hypothetical protein